jgi:hypothetical protein
VGFLRYVRFDNWQDVDFLSAVDVERAHCAATLNERKDDILVRGAASLFEACFLADKGLVNHDDFAFTAHLSGIADAERFADAHPGKPRGFHAAIEHALNLAS